MSGSLSTTEREGVKKKKYWLGCFDRSTCFFLVFFFFFIVFLVLLLCSCISLLAAVQRENSWCFAKRVVNSSSFCVAVPVRDGDKIGNLLLFHGLLVSLGLPYVRLVSLIDYFIDEPSSK